MTKPREDISTGDDERTREPFYCVITAEVNIEEPDFRDVCEVRLQEEINQTLEENFDMFPVGGVSICALGSKLIMAQALSTRWNNWPNAGEG